MYPICIRFHGIISCNMYRMHSYGHPYKLRLTQLKASFQFGQIAIAMDVLLVIGIVLLILFSILYGNFVQNSGAQLETQLTIGGLR